MFQVQNLLTPLSSHDMSRCIKCDRLGGEDSIQVAFSTKFHLVSNFRGL
jgi:hypothetical protein